MKADPSRLADSPDAGAAGSTPPAAVDLAHLNRFTMGNRALEAEVLEMFAGHLSTYIGELARAETHKAWIQAAHTLKGSAWAIGARQLGRQAESAEHLNIASGEARAEALAAIATAAADVDDFIRARLAADRAA